MRFDKYGIQKTGPAVDFDVQSIIDRERERDNDDDKNSMEAELAEARYAAATPILMHGVKHRNRYPTKVHTNAHALN